MAIELSDRLEAVRAAARTEIASSGALTLTEAALVDEMVLALKGAEDARLAGVSVAEDKASKRALAFAEQLGLTPKSRRLAKGAGGVEQQDPFAALDELSEKRASRAQAS